MKLLQKCATLLLITSLTILSIGGCSLPKEPLTLNGVYFDTYISFTVYDNKDVSAMYVAMDMCEEFENIFSPTSPESELVKINNRLLDNISNNEDEYTCVISDDMMNVLITSIEYCKSTDNSFNPALGSVTSLWDFSGDSSVIPDASSIEKALTHTDINMITIDEANNLLTIKDPELKIDLGAVAKGYVADNIVKMMKEKDCSKAIISLGGNIYCIGANDNKGYKVGIQKPFGEKNEYIKSISVSNRSVVTSGIYERYFKNDKKLYHHIINPQTGYPVDNELSSVTIIGRSSTQCDILSTAILVMGKEKGLQYLESFDDIDVIILDKENNIYNN